MKLRTREGCRGRWMGSALVMLALALLPAPSRANKNGSNPEIDHSHQSLESVNQAVSRECAHGRHFAGISEAGFKRTGDGFSLEVTCHFDKVHVKSTDECTHNCDYNPIKVISVKLSPADLARLAKIGCPDPILCAANATRKLIDAGERRVVVLAYSASPIDEFEYDGPNNLDSGPLRDFSIWSVLIRKHAHSRPTMISTTSYVIELWPPEADRAAAAVFISSYSFAARDLNQALRLPILCRSNLIFSKQTILDVVKDAHVTRRSKPAGQPVITDKELSDWLFRRKLWATNC